MPHTGAYSRVHTLSHVHSFWPDSSFFTHFPNGWQGGMQIKSSRETNKNIFFFGQRGSYNCLFFSLTSQQPIKRSKFFVPMEIVEKEFNLWPCSNYFFVFCWCPIFRQKISTWRIIIISFIAVAWTRQPLVLSHNTLSSGKRQKECCVTGVLCERNPPPVERVLYDKSVVWKSRALCNKENALRDKIKHRLHRRLALNQFI